MTDLTGLGCAAGWSPRVEQGETQSNGAPESSPWIVGTPGMASLLRPLAEGMRITTGRRVRQLERRGKDWHLWFDDESSAGPFQAVAVTVPANETARLLVHVPVLSDALASVRMEPCWTLMIATQNHVMPPIDVMHNVSKSIRWLTRDNTKPGRNPRGDAMVILGSAQWNEGARHLDPQAAAEELWADACDALSLAPLRPSHMIAHLWRDGLTTSALGQSHLFAKDQNAGVAGDWCRGATAEDAFESGTSLGRAMVAALT
nr:FAD-dependent oxidoreductase [Hyphomicrobium methylovorum]